MSRRAPLFLAGATATGKSAVALHLAEEIEGEIISVDSMQVYRGMDIGTAKPTPGERGRVRHHLIDVVDLTTPFDAAQYVRLAGAAQTEIEARGHVPIFCGGTGFYFQAFLGGLGTAPRALPELRAQLQQVPLPDLLRELEACDAVTYSRIDRANRRRVTRALEVVRLTGRPFSQQRADWSKRHGSSLASGEPGAAFFGLERAREDLWERIDARVDRMFAEGLVAETEALLRKGLADNPAALQALGYRQVLDYLRGRTSVEEAVRLVKQRTRQYAKRQMTWFRRQAELQWITVGAGDSAESVARDLAVRYRAASVRTGCPS